MNAEDAVRISNSVIDRTDVTWILTKIEEAAYQGKFFVYLSYSEGFSDLQKSKLESLGYEVYDDYPRVKICWK